MTHCHRQTKQAPASTSMCGSYASSCGAKCHKQELCVCVCVCVCACVCICVHTPLQGQFFRMSESDLPLKVGDSAVRLEYSQKVYLQALFLDTIENYLQLRAECTLGSVQTHTKLTSAKIKNCPSYAHLKW